MSETKEQNYYAAKSYLFFFEQVLYENQRDADKRWGKKKEVEEEA